MRRVVGVLVSAGVVASVGCGGQSQPARTASSALAGWRAVDDTPGVSQLAPDLEGLHVLGRTDRRALVRNGDVIRSSTFTFATPKEAAAARKRGAGDDYQRQLEHAFRGDTVSRGPGVGIRLLVPRPTGAGSDTVEVYLRASGRTLALVELVSEDGFDPAVRDRVLRRFSR